MGSEPFKFGQFDEENQKGQVNGLANFCWRGIIKIEAALIAGKGRIIKTGSLGDVMQESIQAALTVAKNIANKEKLKKIFLKLMIYTFMSPKELPQKMVLQQVLQCVQQ